MLDRLGTADRIAGGGAVLALLSALLPWYRFDDGGFHVTANAFGTGFFGDILFLCAAAMIVVLLVRAEVIMLNLHVDDRRVLLGLGLAAFAAVLLQLLVGVNGSGPFHFAAIGIGVALIAAGAMALGAIRGRDTAVGAHSVAARRR